MARPAALVLVAALVVVSAIACGGQRVDASASQPTTDASTLARLRTIARNLAVENGDAGAQGRTAVLTTRKAARQLLSEPLDGADPDRPTYLIWMYGNFGPEEAARPIGYLLVGVVDGRTTQLVHSRVVPGELHPGLPSPEKLGLPELPLIGDVEAAAPDAETLVRLRNIARTHARSAGEPAPTADYFATNEQDAVWALGGSSGNPDQPAYLIVLRGSFESHHATPDGTPLPPTRFLALTLAANDLRLLTQSWRDAAPRTDRLGTPVRLLDP